MKYRPFYIAFLLVLLMAVSALSQEKPHDKATITNAERDEVQAFAKQFVKRLQQTNDLSPLIQEFFIRDFASCLHKGLDKDAEERHGKKLLMSSTEILRGYIASTNLLYLNTVGVTFDEGNGVKGDYDPFKSTFSPCIQKQIDALNSGYNLLYDDEKLIDRKKFLHELRQTEKVVAEARQFLMRKKILTKPGFLKEFNYYSTSYWLGYIVNSHVTDDEFCVRHGVKTYTVTTPTWLVLGLTKENGKLKVSLAGIYVD